MGVKIVLAIVVLYILTAVGVSWWLWGYLHAQDYPPSETIRNLVLSWGGLLAIGLAAWRSMVAQKQVEATQAGLLSARYQRAVEMLGNNLLPIRLGGIHALLNIALEHRAEYQMEVVDLLNAHLPESEVRDDGAVVRAPPETPEERAAQRAIKILEFRDFSPRTMPSPLVPKK